MGSMCSKRPVVSQNSKPVKQMTKYSKISDFKKKYEYICMLGNGSFGKVRLYRDKFCKEMKYAIKTIKKEGISAYLRDCIIEEVNILRDLDHPNIIKYYETYEDDYYINIVMEYLSGEDLFKVIAMKKYNNYTEKDACDIIKHIFKALAFIHNKKIVHRDIKPENILFSIPGDFRTLKLIDFGLSTHTLGKNGKSVGSPYYMAPEIIDGSYTFKTDIWSVGVILYVLMTGKYPYTGQDQEEVFYNIKNKEYNMKPINQSQCTKYAKDLISKLLVKEEKERLSIEEALDHPWFKKWSDDSCYNSNGHSKTSSSSTSTPILENEIIESIKQFTLKNSFHKEVLFYMAKISRDEEISKLKQIFLNLDKDNTGTLTFDEIITAFEEIGLQVDKQELNTIWEGLDFHKDGEVNYTEFLAATISSLNFLKEEKLWVAFKYFESTNDSGYITADSVIDALKTCNLSINEDELKVFFDDFQKSGKKFNFEEFKKMVSRENK